MSEKTRDEIQALKLSWKEDPIWDIEETEGFEAHHDELLRYRLEMEAYWNREYNQEIERFAAEIGIPGNISLAKHIRFLEERIGELEHLKDHGHGF